MKESVKIDPSTVMLMAQEQGYHKRGGRVYADCNGCLRSAVTTGELIHALYSHIAKTHGYQEKSLDEILVCLDKAQRDYQMKRGACFNPEILYTISNIGEVVFNCDVYQTEVDVTELESNYGSMESIVREVWQKRIHGNAVLEASIKWEPLTSSGTPMKKMFIVMACATLSYLAFAYSEKVGDFTWQYQYDQAGGAILQDDNNISICVSPQPSGTVIIPSMLGGLPVTGIGYRAFAGCETLTSITIPSNVTSIGYGAFEGCTGLTNVVIEAESINFMTVGANAFETTTTVAIEHIDGLYFGGWTNANGVIISDPFHSTTVVTVSPRWLNEGDEYGEHLIFFEDFERDSMEFELATVGTFPNPACIQDSMGVDGSRGFGFGRSDCRSNAHFDYVNTLIATFNKRYFITKVEFDEMERYGNTGSVGNIILNRRGDEQLENHDFCREPSNDKKADNEFRHCDITIGGMATNVSFQVVDITTVSEEFIDNVKIYGRLARQCTISFDANGGTGDMNAQTAIEGDALVLASNAFVRAGYLFQGWSVKANDDILYADGATISDVLVDMDGVTLYAVWKPCTPEITPAEDSVFANASQTVSISHDGNDVVILYTTDGSDPTEDGREYKGEFSVYESSTIRVVAYGAGRYSNEACVTLTRTEELSEAVNLYGYLMETDTSNPWTVVTDVSHDDVSCVKSGAIGHGGTTWLQTSVRKAGTVSFWWKAACEEAEEEDGETYWYDYGSFFVDGVEKAKIAGNDTGWRKVEVAMPTGGKHVFRWEYRKDGATSYSPDCIWLDQVQWIPADGSGYTLTTPEPVPYSWLTGYNLGLDSDFETAAKQATGKVDTKGRSMAVWQDYVAGTDPTNPNDFLRAVISLTNDVPYVSWTPNLNTNGEVRVYTVMGKTNLTDAAWVCPTNTALRFFKVKVELP